MLATLTSKGQLTLPKPIREALGLAAGTRLDFSIGTSGETKGLLIARPMTHTALGLAGLLKQPGRAPVSLEAMDKAVQDTAAELHARTVVRAKRAP